MGIIMACLRDAEYSDLLGLGYVGSKFFSRDPDCLAISSCSAAVGQPRLVYAIPNAFFFCFPCVCFTITYSPCRTICTRCFRLITFEICRIEK